MSSDTKFESCNHCQIQDVLSFDSMLEMWLCQDCTDDVRGADIVVFECPRPKRCEPNDHIWDGPEYRDENISSATCSKCGMTAFDFSMWHGP